MGRCKQCYHRVNKCLNPEKIESGESGFFKFPDSISPMFHESGECGFFSFPGFTLCNPLEIKKNIDIILNPENVEKIRNPDSTLFHESGFFRIRILKISGFNLLKSLNFKSGESGFPKGNKITGFNAGIYF